MAEKYPDKIKPADDADYDFYCADSSERREWLANNGFRLIYAPDRTYWDALLVDMYEHPEHPIQVLIRSNVDKYIKAFESIDCETFYSRLWKSAPFRKFHNVNERAAFRSEVCHYFNQLFSRISDGEAV